MSTTITTTPQQPTPAANKAIYVVLGTLIAEPNYRYVADIKSEASTLLARLKCDKLPSTNEGFFNVSDIVKTLIVPAKPNPVAGWQDAAIAARYTATFMEEYGTPPVVATGVTTIASGIVWKAYFNQQAIPITSGYLGTGTTMRALLTNRPRSYDMRSNQHDFLTGLKDSAVDFVATIIYPTRTFNVVGTLTDPMLSASFNMGAAGLLALTSGQTSDGLAGNVGFPLSAAQTYAQYTARALADGALAETNACAQTTYFRLIGENPFGQSYTVTINMGANQSATYTLTINDCTNYPQQLVYFRNALGGIDSYNFKMKNRKAIGAERSTYSRNSDVYGRTVFESIWQTQYTERVDLNSDWLTDAEFVWLQEMFLTSELWVLQNGVLVEAVMIPTEYRLNTRQVDKLNQINFAINIAYKNNTL